MNKQQRQLKPRWRLTSIDARLRSRLLSKLLLNSQSRSALVLSL